MGASEKKDIFEKAEEFKKDNPGVVEAMEAFGFSMEAYQASLDAVYKTQVITSDSTGEAYAGLEPSS